MKSFCQLQVVQSEEVKKKKVCTQKEQGLMFMRSDGFFLK